MEKLFAPWRMEYIKCGGAATDSCIFCDKPKEPDMRANLILHVDPQVLVIMNRFPYNNGHLMVVPRKHVSSLDNLSEIELLAVFNMVRISTGILHETCRPEGFNIGMNIGRVAGAGIDAHIHVHVVPRWNGDTNYMPILGETKVVSEHLLSTYDGMLPYFQKINS